MPTDYPRRPHLRPGLPFPSIREPPCPPPAKRGLASISAAPLPMSRSKSGGRRFSAKILTTPRGAGARRPRRRSRAVLRRGGARARRSVDHHPRHDAGDQRDHRAQGRQDRARHHRGVPRHDRDPPREPLRAIRRQYRPAAAAGAAPLRFVVPERIDAHGRVVTPLDEARVERIAAEHRGAAASRASRSASAQLHQPGARAAHRATSSRRACPA